MVSSQNLEKNLPEKQSIAILTGVTASGKTAIALEFARTRGDIEIVNADSLLVYRGMDIGTAKPTRAELKETPHHLIDIRNPDEPFTAGDFVRGVEKATADIHARGKRALIVGGTGFYLKALLYGLWEAPASDHDLRAKLEALTSVELHKKLHSLDALSAERIGETDRYRLIRALETIELSGMTPTELETKQKLRKKPAHLHLLITDRENEELYFRIEKRTEEMIHSGLIDEVKKLSENFSGARPLDAVGYRETLLYLDGVEPNGRKIRPGLPGLADEITLSTRQLVKRQRTWFKGQFLRGENESSDAEHFVLDQDREMLLEKLGKIYYMQ